MTGKDYFQYSASNGIGIEPDGGHVTWAIPLTSDVRVVCYRRDVLEQAGVDEGNAFQNSANFENTLAKLKTSGVDTPLAMPTRKSNIGLHNLASWIWSFGGDFCDPKGTKIEFDAPKALEGIKAYFRLGCYTAGRGFDENDASFAFLTGHAAILMCDNLNPDYILNPEVRASLGIAAALDTPFVGPDVLVIWKHSRYPEEALELIRFLSRPESGKFLYPTFGFPPYREGWQYPPFDRPQYRAMMHALQTGRSFPANQLWALIEKRFTDIIPEIWDEVFANPQNSDTIVEQKINAMARRLRMTLES
jgi:ABC-type glycerol-3-phosphate transport system substrate-binding protein